MYINSKKLNLAAVANLLVILMISCTNNSPVHNKSIPVMSIDCQASDWDPYTGTFQLNISYKGTSSPVNASTLNVMVNNITVTSQLTIDNDSATGMITGLNTCDGVNVFATIADNAGTLTSASCSLPALAINYPANGTTIDDPLPALSIAYDYRTTGTGFTVSMDTDTITSLCGNTVSTGTVCQKPMGQYITPPGTHSVSAYRCFAHGGPCCDKTSVFAFVPPVPSVTILSPSGYIGSANANATILFSDTTNKLGLDPNTYNILVNGSSVTGSFTTSVNSTLPGFSLTPTSFTAQGSVSLGTSINNTLQASVTNLFYGVTGFASLSFTVDSTPPTLTIAQPVSGSASGGTSGTLLPYFIYPNAVIPYEVTYNDTQSGVNPSSFAISANGAAGTVSATSISATGTLPVMIPLTSGSNGTGVYTITAQVSDNVGNIGYGNSVISLSLADIGIDSATVAVGSQFTIPMNVFIDPSHAYGLGRYDISIDFNQSILNFVSVSGSASGYPGVAYASEFANPPNYYLISSGIDINAINQLASGYYPNPVGLFNVANLTFYAASPGTTTLTIIVNALNDTTGAAVPSSRVQSGTVTVQ